MHDMQRRVQEAVDGLVVSGAERGLQVAVYRHGEPVVDAVAGVADPATGRPVTPDTPIYCYSLGKGATATVAHVLVERGLFDYDTPIVELWPEFGAHGKERATIRHALTHTVGVPGLPAGTTPEDVCDWDKMCATIADAEPWWESGTKTAYHAYTFGYIIGEIVRRAAGKPISQVLREDVAAPLGVADELYFGAPATELGRLARLEDAPAARSSSPRCRTTRRSSSGHRARCSRPPHSATAKTCCWPTSPPAARCPRARWLACTPRCWARWTACGSSRRNGCAR
jgi:CubicO group peptidase (beta-lactamase class C family)